MPCALTEIEPPTVKMSVDCIACTAKRGCSAFWMSCQVAPGCTVTVFAASLSTMRLNFIMSSTTVPLRNACPPMLWRWPATVTLSLLSRANASAREMSSMLRTATMP